MKPLNPTDGFSMHGWMATELKLSCYELVAYAIVHQFSQSSAGVYKGGVPYLAAWLNCSEVTARKHLHTLEQKGLIVSERGTREGVPFCYYQVVENHIPKILEGTPQNLSGYPTKSLGYTPKNLMVDNNIDNNIDINNPPYPPKRGFVAPAEEEVKAYCKEKGYTHVDAEAFIAFYQSKGWKIGTSPMKDWRAAVVTWEKRHKSEAAQSAKPSAISGNYLGDSFTKYYE